MALDDWLGGKAATPEFPEWRDPVNQPDSTADILRGIRALGVEPDPDRPGVPDTREGILERGRPGYIAPGPVSDQWRADPAEYPEQVIEGARVVPGTNGQVDSAGYQTELMIAQQVAVNQLHAQQQQDREAAERIASAALGQYIAPPAPVAARTPTR